jgi:hypothetical protein
MLLASTQPLPLQEFCPLQAFLALLQALCPLQALTPEQAFVCCAWAAVTTVAAANSDAAAMVSDFFI